MIRGRIARISHRVTSMPLIKSYTIGSDCHKRGPDATLALSNSCTSVEIKTGVNNTRRFIPLSSSSSSPSSLEGCLALSRLTSLDWFAVSLAGYLLYQTPRPNPGAQSAGTTLTLPKSSYGLLVAVKILSFVCPNVGKRSG